MKAICIVSSGQPSANPRLVKEAVYLQQAGYTVTVIYCPLSSWADEFDRMLFAKHPDITWIKAGFHSRDQRPGNYYARIRKKFFGLVYGFLGDVFDAGIRSVSLYSKELVRQAKKQEAALYIGHNPAALKAVVLASKKYKAYCSFDFEDFHRGEFPKDHPEGKIYARLEDKFVPSLDMATTASPLITEAYQRIFPETTFTTINNCFPKSYFPGRLSTLPASPLKLFWFSQSVGKNRGIEQVIYAMGKTSEHQIELTLLGNCTVGMRSYLESIAAEAGLKGERVKFLPPVPESAITAVASQHHLGIAGEVAYTVNRDICLTNKIFMYLGAGNAILFSDTKAQVRFLETYPGSGILYKQNDAGSLADVLRLCIRDRSLVEKIRSHNYELGKDILNMDREKEKLLEIVGAKIIEKDHDAK